MLAHVLDLPSKVALMERDLRLRADERFGRVREPVVAVIVARVHGVGERRAERAKVAPERVAIQEEDMVRVHGADGRLDAVVKDWQADLGLVGRLVERVVPCHPGVVAVVLAGVSRCLL